LEHKENDIDLTATLRKSVDKQLEPGAPATASG
jgi:hypothetical protein